MINVVWISLQDIKQSRLSIPKRLVNKDKTQFRIKSEADAKDLLRWYWYGNRHADFLLGFKLTFNDTLFWGFWKKEST